VVTGFGGEQGDVVGGYVGDVGEDDVDPALELLGEGSEEVALVDRGGEVVAGGDYSCRVDVGAVQGNRRELVEDGQTQGARAAAEVEHGLRTFADRRVHQEFAADSGDEDAGAQKDAHAAEVGIADHLFEGFAGGAALDQGGQGPGVVGGGFGQDSRLILGEYAAGLAEAGDGFGTGHGVGF
jgi:hypothetical protein